MNKKQELGPKDAAHLVFEKIQADPEKLEKIKNMNKSGSDFYVGNMAFHETYGTITSGPCNKINESFIENVYNPLGFDVVAQSIDDIPCDAWMIGYFGSLIKASV